VTSRLPVVAGGVVAVVGAVVLFLLPQADDRGAAWLAVALVVVVAAMLGGGFLLARNGVPPLLVLSVASAQLGVGLLWLRPWGFIYLGAALVLLGVWLMRRGGLLPGRVDDTETAPARVPKPEVPQAFLDTLALCIDQPDEVVLGLSDVAHADTMSEDEFRKALIRVPGWDGEFAGQFYGYLRRRPTLALTVWNIAGGVRDHVLTRAQFDQTVRAEVAWDDR
jgi:hypothetical protein